MALVRLSEEAPESGHELTLTFERGDVVAIDGQAMSPASVLAHLNQVGGAHGVVVLISLRTVTSA